MANEVKWEPTKEQKEAYEAAVAYQKEQGVEKKWRMPNTQEMFDKFVEKYGAPKKEVVEEKTEEKAWQKSLLTAGNGKIELSKDGTKYKIEVPRVTVSQDKEGKTIVTPVPKLDKDGKQIVSKKGTPLIERDTYMVNRKMLHIHSLDKNDKPFSFTYNPAKKDEKGNAKEEMVGKLVNGKFEQVPMKEFQSAARWANMVTIVKDKEKFQAKEAETKKRLDALKEKSKGAER